jgi:hypothetical protein
VLPSIGELIKPSGEGKFAIGRVVSNLEDVSLHVHQKPFHKNLPASFARLHNETHPLQSSSKDHLRWE